VEEELKLFTEFVLNLPFLKDFHVLGKPFLPDLVMKTLVLKKFLNLKKKWILRSKS
jgi:hypothetical protein